MTPAVDPERARGAGVAIVRRLRDAGHEAYFCGGCVRDELLGLHPTDYDIATDATPQRVKQLFEKTAEVGVAFGVVLVIVDPTGSRGAGDGGGLGGSGGGLKPVEVATFRSDGPYSDARRPDVVHFSDARADALRRDFTINALLLDPLAEPGVPGTPDGAAGLPPVRGKVIDFVGGVEDLKRKVVRAVGDADQRLAEDHLRALRAVRFAARLGFAIDVGTRQAIRRHAMELRGVSRERIGQEVRRMLVHPARAEAVWLLQDLGLDVPVLDEPHVENPPPLHTAGAVRSALANLEPARGGEMEYATCLAAWAVDRGWRPGSAPPDGGSKRRGRQEELVTRWRRALCLSNEERDGLRDILVLFGYLIERWDGMRVCVQKRTAAHPWFGEALRVATAKDQALGARVRVRLGELEGIAGGIAPEPLANGDDLLAMGIKSGPAFKRVLDEVYDAQLEGRVTSREKALELARSLGV